LIPNTLVPQHELLDAERTQELLEKYKITRAELPKIRKSDATLTEIKPKNGDVIKITRFNPIVGESYYYRVVIEG